LFVSRFFDIFTTYKYIPNLEGEKNPLVSVFKLNWTGTLIIQILVLLILIYTVYIYCFKTIKTQKLDDKTTLKQFISIFHFGNPNDFSKLFYKFPNNKYSLIYSIGAIVSKGLIIFSFLVGTSTTMLIVSEEYKNIYKEYNIPRILYFLSIGIMIIIAIDFYKREKQKRIK